MKYINKRTVILIIATITIIILFFLSRLPEDEPINVSEDNFISKTAFEHIEKEKAKKEKLQTEVAFLQRGTEKRPLPLYNITSQKLWMDYRAITDTSSPQYSIVNNAQVGTDGVLRYNGYICVALGQKYGNIGDKFLIQIGNKKVKCIFADQKKYSDTLNGEGWLDPYGNLLEIIVDANVINSDCRSMGDMNYTRALNGKVTAIWKIKK